MSDIKCVCEACGAKYRLPAEFAGRSARCKKCGEKFKVPAEKTIEDSVLDWLSDEAAEEEVVDQPRVINMPKSTTGDSSDASRKKSNVIRIKSGSQPPDAH